MKKNHLFSLFIIFVFLFCSCDNNIEQLKEGITPVITAEKEAVDSFSKIGEVKTVISIDPALLFPSSRSAVVSSDILPEDQDGVTSIFHLVTFDSLEKNFEKYEEYLVSQRQFRVTFDTTRIYVPFLVYYFHTKEGQHKILSFANQTGVPALAQPLKNFRNIDVDFPDIVIQKKIANILESIDDKIENNKQINDNLFCITQNLAA